MGPLVALNFTFTDLATNAEQSLHCLYATGDQEMSEVSESQLIQRPELSLPDSTVAKGCVCCVHRGRCPVHSETQTAEERTDMPSH